MDKEVDQKDLSQRNLRELILQDPHRPTWHLCAPEGHCYPFDPNGGIFWKGRYHLFYIFQNDDNEHCFGHVSSIDLLHWRWHPCSLYPGKDDVDRGMYSGNCFINADGRPTMMYMGVGAGDCIAVASDDDLDHWEKLGNNPMKIENSTEREVDQWDPFAWYDNGSYYTITGSNPRTIDPIAITKASSLDGPWKCLGNFYDEELPGIQDHEDVSCPEFFKLGNKDILLCISHSMGCRAYIGEFKNEKFHPESHQRFNFPGGTFFAPESILDDKGRRVMWTWFIDSKTSEYPWSGTMSMPLVMELAEDEKSIILSPPEEMKSLRFNPVSEEDFIVKKDTTEFLKEISGTALELQVEISPGKAKHFGIKVCCSPDGREETPVIFNIDKNEITVDLRKSSLDEKVEYFDKVMHGEKNKVDSQKVPFAFKDGEKISLQLFLDKSTMELFVNGRQFISQRIYPTLADSTKIVFFAEDSDIEVSNINSWSLSPTMPW